MRWADPLWLLLPLVMAVPILVRWRLKPRALGVPAIKAFTSLPPSRLAPLRRLPEFLRVVALVAIAIALARPQLRAGPSQRDTEGLDIVLVLDTSGSMQIKDYVWKGARASRIEVVKAVIGDFVRERPDDRIGMVVFGTEAFTQAPLTLDHDLLIRFVNRLKIGVAGDATAMGDGIATAVTRLKSIAAKSKVAILLTDGGNNAGRVDPLAAAQAAKALGVKVYTIGIGAAPQAGEKASLDLDEGVLQAVAEATSARYFRAGDTDTLVKVYETIDQLEKSKVHVDTFGQAEEAYRPFALIALLALLAELAFGLTRLRRVP